MQEFRRLAKLQGFDADDLIRDSLQTVVREVVTEVTQDNIRGAGEIITGLLPKVLAGLAKDLESKDWMIRSRAQAAVLKYAMEFRDKGGKDEDLGTINVIHQVALPDTPLGHATAEAIEVIEAEEADSYVEAFEKDWPECERCKERKPPEAMRSRGDGRVLCSSCDLSRAYGKRLDPTAMFSRDPEFGDAE